MSDYSEPAQEMSAQDRNFSRAMLSLKEEIEAINWYQQRIAVTDDPDLKAILEHNRNEEMEHASMALEWLRRNMTGWDDALKTFLFTEDKITEVEKAGKK